MQSDTRNGSDKIFKKSKKANTLLKASFGLDFEFKILIY